MPDQKILDEYARLVSPLYLSIDLNIARNRSLEKLRDTLLPKLLSGQLRIPETEQQIACLADRQAKAL